MLTLFAIPKSFRGPIATIQRNAVRSWTLLRPKPEIILLGDDEGTAEVAKEFGISHVPQVARNDHGTPLLNDLFDQAQRNSAHEVLCYVNSDIILMSDFLPAIRAVGLRKFLLVGQRWDLDVESPLDFESDWEISLLEHLAKGGRLHGHTGIDYFVFPRGLYQDLPPLAIGRTAWDNWLIYKARAMNIPVIDATQRTTAIHQNHDYGHHEQGVKGIWTGAEAKLNLELAGGMDHVFTLKDATYELTSHGLRAPERTWERIFREIDIQMQFHPGRRSWLMIIKRCLLLVSRLTGRRVKSVEVEGA